MTNAECKQIVALLGEYADGELAPEEMARLEAHLAGCPRCKDALAAIQQVDRALLALEAPEVSPTELERLATSMKRMVKGRKRGARRSWRESLSWSRLVPVAAAAAALFAVYSLTEQFPGVERRRSRETRLEDSGAISAREEAGDNKVPIPTPTVPAPDVARQDRVDLEHDESVALSSGAGEAGSPAPRAAPEMAMRPMARAATPGAETARSGKGDDAKGAGGSDDSRKPASVDLEVAAQEPDSTRAKSWELRAIALSAEAHAASGSEADCVVLAARIQNFIVRHPADTRIDSLRTLLTALPCAP